MSKYKKLELTWVGKDERPRLEPRILMPDQSKSYQSASDSPPNIENSLIFGDNLLALKALEERYSGQVKCVFIDPPYNTGSAFEHYDDGMEHSLWLSLMKDRLELLRGLLSNDGSIWIAIDDNECHYLKVVCDEVFGRKCFMASVSWRSADSSNNDAKKFSLDHNHILVYSKEPDWKTIPLARTEEANAHYANPDNDPRGPWFSGNLSSPNPRPNLRYIVRGPTGIEIHPPRNGWRWSEARMNEMIQRKEIVFSKDGTRVIKKTYLADQGGLSPSTMWDNIEITGHNRQAKYELKKIFPDAATSDLFATPKPERLIKHILDIATVHGDLVLDSFAGSGTTGAVAHKMGRRWIMVELGEHCHTHIIPRIKKVIDGNDSGGITEMVGWKGGGGFRYFRLAPSLLKQDEFGNWIINSTYNPEMLAEAVCKLEGFNYQPSSTIYWQHGQSTERDLIYVTTQTLTHSQLQALSEAVGTERTLLVMCSAYRGNPDTFANLTLKKIPKSVQDKCEWDKDDYSLAIANPIATPDDDDDVAVEPPEEVAATPTVQPAPAPAKRRGRPPKVRPENPGQQTLL